jgi:hypothetical protein
MKVKFHAMETLALEGNEWSASFSSCFIGVKKFLVLCKIGGRVDPGAGLDMVAMKRKFLPLQEQNPSHSAHLFSIQKPLNIFLIEFCKPLLDFSILYGIH